MNGTHQNGDVAKIDGKMTFCLPTVRKDVAIGDAGLSRLGGQGPAFRIVDRGQVRIGGQGPAFRRMIADSGRVRLGGQGPLFR